MKKYVIFVLALFLAASVALLGCEKKQAAPPPAAQPAVAPPPAPAPTPVPIPTPPPAPAKPAKK